MAEDAPREPVQQAVKATFSLPIGGTSLQASVHLPPGRTTLTQFLPIIQNLENAVIGRVAEEAQAVSTPISCRAGCASCCRQMVPISLFEAEALTEWLKTLPEDRLAVLRERFHRTLTALRDSGVLESFLNEDWLLDDQRTTQLAVDYFHAGVACPFLENESCSIHPIRPLSCREYLVTSPPELCQDPSMHNVAGVQLPLRLSRAMFAFGQQIEENRRGWIPLVFLLAWGKNGASPGDAVAGTGGEVLKKFLDQVSRVSETTPSEQPKT